MAAATIPSSPELFISHASIQLRQPPRIYEWRTQVTGQPQQQQQQQLQSELEEAPVECIKQNGSVTATKGATTTKATPTYTPPRIQGNEARRKNLPQTLCNFLEVERHDSAWNRVTN